MSTSAIIYLPLVDHRCPPTGHFSRSQKHDKHIWKGQEYPLNTPEQVAEFNSTLVQALAAFPGRVARPTPLIIHTVDPEPISAPKKPKGWNLTKEGRASRKMMPRNALHPAFI